MASSSSTFTMAIAHRRFSCLTPSTTPSFLSRVPEQSSGGNFSGLHPLSGGVHNNIAIHSVERQQIPGSVRTLNESDDRDEWLRCLVSGALDDIITTDVTWDYPQMAESAPVPSCPNSESWQHERMVHQPVLAPNPQPLYPAVSPPSPKRTKARMRWTMEMHDRFIDAVNLLGGSESAKPKAILDIMNVEGLTRGRVKSHLQKYKMAQVKHRPSEVAGTSVETTMPNEGIPSDVQTRIQEFALQVQVELQKKLHDMVEKTRHDLLEIHRSILENHVMSLHKLEERQNLNMDHRTVHILPGPAASSAAHPATLLVRGFRGERSQEGDDGGSQANQVTGTGSPSNDSGA